MKKLNATGPIGIAIRGNDVYQYYKDTEDILIKDRFDKRIRIFVLPEKKEYVIERIKKIGDFEGLSVFDDVGHTGAKLNNVCMISFPLSDGKSKIEEIKLKLSSIQGVVGVEDQVSRLREQEYLLSKAEEYRDLSRRIGYFLPTEIMCKDDGKELQLASISQQQPRTASELRQYLEKLRESLNLVTVDYETYGNKIVMASVRRSDGFSKTIIVNDKQELLEKFKKILPDVDIEIVPDEKDLIEKVHEYRKKADVEIIHGASLLEKNKDKSVFPSTRGRPKDKFDVPIHYRSVPAIQVVVSDGIIPSGDSLYTCKHQKRHGKRSLEDLLEFLLSDTETLQKTDYKNFGVYSKLKNSSDVDRFKEEINRTVYHNVKDAEAHLKLGEFLLFDQGFLALPMLYSIDLEKVFSKPMEEIGEAILTSELLSKGVFPKASDEYTKLREIKERLIEKHKRIFSEDYGKRVEGRWIYSAYAFIPEIIFENKQEFGPYILSTFEKLFSLKEGIGTFGIDECGRHTIFDPHSFSINCVSAYMLFGSKIFTDDRIANKLFDSFCKMYKNLEETKQIGGCEIVYISPFDSEMFIGGNAYQTEEAVKKIKSMHPFLLTDYNKHVDFFVPLNKKQAIATESGKTIKLGWKGASKSDPDAIRKAEKSIVEKFVRHGLREAKRELVLQVENIEKLVYPTESYRISGRLSKRPEDYRKRGFRTNVLVEGVDAYRKAYRHEPTGFFDFFVTENGIEFSDWPTGRIDSSFYREYLLERLKPILPLLETERSYGNSRLTDYF
jgi:hypothetical protein